MLSADNAMVLAILVLGLPRHQQQKALRYGILGAFLFRGAAIVFAGHMIQLSLVKLVGGATIGTIKPPLRRSRARTGVTDSHARIALSC